MNGSKSISRHPGFTLVELLVVIAIIGILIAMLLPAIQSARESGRRTQCKNNVKQLALGLALHHAAKKALPYASGGAAYSAETTGPVWTTALLPYIEEQALQSRIDFKKHVRDLPVEIVTTVIPLYICPTDASAADAILESRFARDNPAKAMGLWYTASMGPTSPDQCPYCPDTKASPTNYCCQGNNFGTQSTATVAAPGGTSYPKDSGVGMFMRSRMAVNYTIVRDGLSHTLLLGETLPRQCSFISAFAVNFNVSATTIPLNTFEDDTTFGVGTSWWKTSGFKSQHTGGANFAMADGSVHFLNEDIDFKTYNELGTRSGGETVAIP
jgi:prepilin-type N-terminal cleavage/methylation domain-containing protein/prepilin-type processing-associated H-X9-DG protein